MQIITVTEIRWCDGYKARSIALLASASVVVAVSLAWFIIRLAASARSGCNECPCLRCPGGRNKVSSYSDVTELSLVTPDGLPQPRGDSPRTTTPPVMPFVVFWKKALFDFAYINNLMMCTAMIFVISIALEPFSSPTITGRNMFLYLTAVSELFAISSVMREFMTSNSVDARFKLPLWAFGTLMAVSLACLALTNIALFVSDFGQIRESGYVMAGVAAAINLATASMLVTHAVALKSTMHVIASVLMLFMDVGMSGLTVYGSTLDPYEREMVAKRVGCFGNLNKSHVDQVVFGALCAILISCASTLVFTSPVAVCAPPRDDGDKKRSEM